MITNKEIRHKNVKRLNMKQHKNENDFFSK